jgi:CheY-like chemotaxis protein
MAVNNDQSALQEKLAGELETVRTIKVHKAETYAVLSAAEQAEIMQLIQTHNDQLIDTLLGELDGLELCEIVKSKISHVHKTEVKQLLLNHRSKKGDV